MSSKILFIVEGIRPEDSIINSFKEHFFSKDLIVTCVYCTCIYKIFKELKQDEFLDIFSLMKEIKYNKEILSQYKRDDFSQIYLFFDYDGHASNASNDKLEHLLDFFTEETENGKLFINYPMVESLKHIENSENFQHLTIDSKIDRSYKTHVNRMCLDSFRTIRYYDQNIWKTLNALHLKKINFIATGNYALPNEIINQKTVFRRQLSDYISQTPSVVSVVSSFPSFFIDYYGIDKMHTFLPDK